MNKHAIILPVMLIAAGNLTQAFAAGSTVAKTIGYDSPAGREYIKVSVTAKDGIVTTASATPLATDSTSLFLQKGFAEKVSGAVVGKAVKGLKVDTVSGASLTTGAFNIFLAKNASALMVAPTPPPPAPKTEPVPPTPSSVENLTLSLKAHIEGNYKVVGDFTPIVGKKVQLYKVVVSYTDGTKDFVFTIGADNTSFVDWHAKQNMVNTYTISAVLDDSSIISGNSVQVVMGANGEPTTEDALGSTSSSETGSVRAEEEQNNQDKNEKMGQMKRDDDAGKQDMHTDTGSTRRPGDAMNQSRKPLLSQKVKDSLVQKLDAIPRENRAVVYNKILVRIDALIAKYKESGASERTMNLLAEIRSIVQDKLASLDDDAVIQDILAP